MKHTEPIEIVARLSATALTVVALTLWLAASGAAWSETDPLQVLVDQGREALAAEDFAKAAAIFDEGRSQAADRVWKGRFTFYQALCDQQAAQVLLPKDDRRIELLQRAARLYGRYVGMYSESGPIYNNLARVQQELEVSWKARGDIDRAEKAFQEADRSYRKAIELDGSGRALYLLNYARFLDLHQKRDQATEIYTRLVKSQPMVEEPHRTMMDRAMAGGAPDELAVYLWEILNAGQARRASAGALEALLDVEFVGRLAEPDEVELLTIVVTGLSRDVYDPRAFEKTEVALGLRRLTGESGVRVGALRVFLLHQGNDFSPNRYDWWVSPDYPRTDPPRGLWPVDGFRALIRSLGEQQRELGDYDLAERYLRLAMELDVNEIDPIAFRQLVRVKTQRDDLTGIDTLATDYEYRLLEGKGHAYRASQSEKIFDFHRSLGEMYSVLGRWGDRNQFTTAIFQLENARTKSRELEDMLGSELAEEYQFTPEMTNLLAQGYESTGEIDRSYAVRLEEAERFRVKEDLAAREKVLEPIRDKALPPQVSPDTRVRYEAAVALPNVAITPLVHDEDEHIHQLLAGQIRFFPADSAEWIELPAGDKELLYGAVGEVFAEQQQRLTLAATLGDEGTESWTPPKSAKLTKRLDALLAQGGTASELTTRRKLVDATKKLRIDRSGNGTLTLKVNGETVALKYKLDDEALKHGVDKPE